MGGAMSTAMGTALGIGASKAIGAGMSAVSTAFEAGFKRLDAIDQAKGKLSALGASTQTTAKVMDSALAAVKGTAYGLGDAATISASAMAAGVKPGKDLTKYLTMTADTAAIAGTSLGDMGAIFGQVQTGQMAYTDDLNQLADRGIPIYQWLAKEAGVTGGEVKKMAGDGKISSEMFFKAINANVGGAAKTIGSTTVKGGFENLRAALGRLGAAALEPGFNRLPGTLTALTGRIDELTPRAKGLSKAFDARVFGEWAPKAKDALGALKDTGVLDKTKSVFQQLSQTLITAGPAVGQIAGSLAQASAALGVSGWQLFLTAIEAGTTVLDTLNPLLKTTADLMQNNTGVVTGLVAAWLAFKTIPSIMGRVTGTLSPMAAQARTATTSMMGLATASSRVVQAGSFGSVQMGRFGSSIGALGERVPVIARMQTAFVNSAVGAERFGRTAGVAAAAGTGLKAAGSAVAGVFGGPLGLALTGAAIAGTAWAASAAKQKQETEAYAAALKDLSETQKVTGQLLIQTRGAVTDSVYAKLGEQVDEYRAKVDAGAKADAKWTNVASDMIGDVVMGWRGSSDDISASMDEQAGAYQNIQRAMDKTGLTSQQMARALGGSAGDWNTFTAQLRAAGDGGAKAAQDMQGLRDKVVAQQDIGRRVVPGITELGEAFRVMGDKSSSSSDKLNALKTAMDALNPARSKTEAIAQQAEAVRKVADAAQGITADAFKGDQLDATTESGAALSRTLADLADKQAQLVATGDQAAIAQGAKSMETAFQQLATATGQPIEKIRELYGELGGKAVDLSVRLSGASETVQDLGLIKAAFEQQPDKKTISIESSQVSQQTLAMLDQLHIKWQQSPDGKTIEINAADNASGKLAIVTQTLQNMPKGKAINVSAHGGNDVLGLLREMGAKVHADNNKNIAVDAPLAQDVINKLRTIGVEVRTNNGKSILVTANDSDYQGKKQDWTRTEYKDIIVRNLQQGTNPMAPGNGIFAGPPSNANGSIRQYADGGIAALESYANGKTPDQALIQKAMPGPGLVQWAEPETGGEAYIPLGKNKRARSQSILATVADMFGLVVMPKDSVPEGVSGWAGALAGIATRGLTSGFDGVRKFADGGIVTGKQLRDLANGKGASRPLTGAPYVWGGVNWGDCCLTSENSVWTPDGAIPMDKIKPGDRVWSYVEGKLEAHEVTAAWFSKTQDVFKVRTRHRSVTGSANHPFLRLVQTSPAKPRDGRRGWEPAEYGVEWARLDELETGDLLVQPKAPRLEFRANTLPSGREISLNEAWLLGLILGDGNVSDTKVEICVYGDLRERARGVLSGMALQASKTRGVRTGIGTSDSDTHGIRAYSTEFARELGDAGFRKPAHEKRIPDCVWGWDEGRQRAFLNGYCDADGHHPKDVAHHGERTYASSSRDLIEDVRYMHIVLGDVVANVSTNRRAKPIAINGKRVKNARPLHSISVRPQGEDLVGSVAARRRPGVALWHDTTDFTIAPVLAITPEGEQETYDIEVEGAHNFIAGGIVVHNSGAMSAFARLAAGLAPFGGRFSTATEADQLTKMGAKMGTGPAGSMRFGWVNGGPGGGHTAGTLPDGTNVEMGGAYGGGMVGGNVGADDPQFTDRAWLPVKDESKYAGSDKDSSSSEDSVASGSSIDSSIDSGYSFDPITQDAEAAGDTSISGRAGNVVAAFVKGQISSLFDVLSMNDQPGWLSALTEYEKQHSENAKKNYDAEKKKLDQDYKDAADARKSDLEDAKTSIEDDYQAKRISADERDVRLLSLRDTYEQDELGKRHDYENSVITLGKKYGQIKGDTERSLSLKQRYESNDLKAGQQLEADKFAREAQLNRDQRSLDSLRDSHAISQSEYERRSRELKTKYDSDVSGMKARYEGNKSQMKSEFDKSQRQFAPSDQYQPNTYKRGSFKPTDPGVNRPKPDEDQPTGGATSGSGSSGSVQDAVKAAFSDRGWDKGAQWSATDYIVDHESGWNPTARNPSSGAFGLFQFLGATKDQYLPDENPDPGVQGQAGKRYIGDRYGTPTAAEEFWKANNWYDQGGIANGIGVMQKNTLKPERVLSPRQTELFNKMVARDFEGGGRSEDLLAQLVELNKALLKQVRSTPSGRPDGTARFAEPRQRAALAGF